MRCVACGEQNREGRKFCAGCGARLSAACPACGTANEPGERFCGECGVPLAAAGAGPQGAAGAAQRAEGERSSRKVVTIIFGDLVGSTALHERLDAESVRQFMEGYYAAMRGAVEAHGGRVTQVMGDGVKAVFGAPRVAEDDAIRAVRAAVEMQHAFRALAEQQSGRVGSTGLRVAVNTGEVVTDDDTEIIGDPVNVAARLQEQGKDGDVVIGGSTQRIVGSLVTLDRLGRFALKGRAEQVEAFRVVSLDPPARAKKSAFVGREEELARLGDVCETTVAKPASGLAVLLGAPGLGKTRLIDEFARRLGDDASVITAHCDSSGGATFAPIVAALRAHLGIEDGARPEELRAAIEDALPGVEGERTRIVSGVASLLAGTPASPEETFFVIRRLLAALAAAKPVVLVIDDLQWAEPLLLDLVEHLVQWGSGVPLLVLVGARPELRDVRSSLASPGGLVADVLTLSGLDAGAAMRLAAGVIGAADLPAALAAKLLATSEGNPLFVAELVKMLVQEGVLEQRGERWVASAALADLEMPPTIHALLAARIERLRPEERTVLERAAVVGRVFSRSAVAALLRETGDLDARLEALRRSEVIERDAGWFLGEPVLRFHHVLIRDAAYRRVLKGTRAELHARLADWIEGKVGDAAEHDETIGRHLEQAHQHLRELGPLDAKGIALGERAARRLSTAGRRALAQDDVALAASVLGRAIACLPADAAERADLALDWCEALLSAGDVGPAGTAIEELDRLGADAPRLRAWHTCFAGQLRTLTDPQGLQATAEGVAAAAQALAGLGDAAGEAKAHHVHALTLARLGQVGGCEAALDRALAAARRAGDHRRSNAVLAGAPRAALWGPSPVTRASGRCLDVVRVLRITQGAPAVEAVALSCQGVLEALRGRTDAAKRMIASARKMVEELGIAQRLFEADVFAGRVALLEGDASAAEQNLRGAYDGLRDLGLGIDAAQAAALLARALLAQGRAAEAEALSHESETLAGDDLQAAIAWRGARAEALAQRGEHGAAVALAQAAVEIAATTDALLDHADARVALAAALRAAGRGGEADAEKRRARELWETKGATLLVEHVAAEDARPKRTARARVPRTTPPSRVRPNAATVLAARFESAFTSRDDPALEALWSDALEVVDHPTGSHYGREGHLDSLRRLARATGPTLAIEPIATLGETLLLSRRSIAAKASAGRRFDVAEWDRVEPVLFELDAHGRFAAVEIFAPDKLGDAMRRLYERYAERLPEGKDGERAAAAALAALLRTNGDPDRMAAILGPDIEGVDHRQLSTWSMRGSEAYLEHLRALRQVADVVEFRQREILALRPDAMLYRVMHSGTERTGGGVYERLFLSLFVADANGRLARAEWFDNDREAEALARFDELAGGAPEPSRPARRVRPNSVTALWERAAAAFAARDLDAVALLLADDFEVVHHPTGQAFDRAQDLDSWRLFLRNESAQLSVEPVATLGASLALGRQRSSASALKGGNFDVGAYELDWIVLWEVDGHGRAKRGEIFADDRLGDAIVRLYQRYAELQPEGPERERAAVCARSLEAFVGPLDREHWAAAMAPEIEQQDHRTLPSWSARGASEALGHLDALLGLTTESAFRLDELLAATPSAWLDRRTHAGFDRKSGGAYERTFLCLSVTGADGRGVRFEFFDPEREAEALARFDELTGGALKSRPVQRRVRTNVATATTERWAAAWSSGDANTCAALLSDTLTYIDHPTHIEYGRDETDATTRAALRSQEPRARHEILATQGESLALWRRWLSASGTSGRFFDVAEYEREELVVSDVDEQGRMRRAEVFAADKLGDALMRFYERCAELLPEGPARTRAEATARSVAALLARAPDLERWNTALSSEIEQFDQRGLAQFGSLERSAIQGLNRAMFELEDFAVCIDDVLGLMPGALLFVATTSGTSRNSGGAFERQMVHIWQFDEGGLLWRAWRFDAESEAEALAQFDALVGGDADPAAEPFANAASRADDRFAGCFNARDWPGILAGVAPELVFDERRRLSRNTAEREVWLEQLRVMFDLPERHFTIRLLATRGEHLSLHRHEFGGNVPDGGGPLEMEPHLALHEVDREGRIVAIVLFDLENFDAAYAELDARFLAGEGAAHPLAARWYSTFSRAVAERNWDELAAATAPELVARDHKLVGWGELHGPAQWLRAVQSMVALGPDVLNRRDHVRTSSRGVLSQLTWLGSRDGGAFEIPVITVVELDAQGRQLRLDIFDPGKLDFARAHFAQIGAGAPSPAPFENVASRAWAGLAACWETHDWERFAALLPAEFHYVDRNRMARLELDRAGYLEYTRSLREMRSIRVARETLATRGERLALMRSRLQVAGADVGPSEIVSLFVSEANERGEIASYVRFDPNDEDAAHAELDARFAAGEGGAAWAVDQAFVRAITERDWDAAVACLAPGFVEHDRRGLAVLGTTHGAEAWVRNFRTLVELAPDTQFRTDHFRPGERGFATVGPWHGSQQGGDYELPLVVVVELDDQGRFTRTDLYDPEQSEQAFARLREMERGAPAPQRFANAASRAADRIQACWTARDWQRLAQISPAGFRFIDRRPYVQLDLDRERFLEFTRSLGEMDSTRVESTLLATRGDRLALLRWRIHVADREVGPSEMDTLNLVESDARGEAVAYLRWDGGELDAAYAELDARHEAGEGASHAATAWLRDFGAALERRDWDALAALCAPNFVGQDHRLVSWGTLRGPAAFPESMRQMVALASDARMRVDHLRAVDRGLITDGLWVGTRDGGAFESPFISVVELGADGKALRLGLYDPHHLDRALAHFEEIQRQETRAPGEALATSNRATAALERWGAGLDHGARTDDWGALRAVCEPGLVFEDRQPFSQLAGGLELAIESLRARVAQGAHIERTLHGTAGDRVAVTRVLWSGGPSDARFEVEYFPVVEVEESGLLSAIILCDDARAAQREAWKLWERLDPTAVAVATPMGELVDAFNARDRDRYRAQLADEIVVEDHRRTGFGRLEGADAYADSLAALWELAPETTVEAGWHWPALGRRGAITLVRRTGVVPDGGAFESDYLNLYTVSGGRITHIELFEPEDLDAALARFEALCSGAAE